MSELVFPNGKYPVALLAPGFAEMHYNYQAAYVDGQIHVKRHQSTDVLKGHVEDLVCKGADGRPLAVEDHPFSLWLDGTPSAGWHLLVRIQGEGGISEWVSYDDCDTWARVTPEYLKQREAQLRA